MGGVGRCGRNPRRRAAGAGLPHWARTLAVLAVMAVSACGGGQIDVQRTTTLPPQPVKATYVFVRTRAQDHAKDYARFSDQIARQLAAKGFARVDSPSQARYALMFSDDGGGRGEDSEERYGRRHGGSKGIEVSASIALFDLTRPDQPGEKVFGGWAQGPEGKVKHDAMVSALIDAILRDFPGEASETYSASLPSAD